jgi:thioredoxin domain-containing protein 10
MWKGNPVLTTVILGLPFGFLCLIFYSVCCGDIMDAEEEEDNDMSHEKND